MRKKTEGFFKNEAVNLEEMLESNSEEKKNIQIDDDQNGQETELQKKRSRKQKANETQAEPRIVKKFKHQDEESSFEKPRIYRKRVGKYKKIQSKKKQGSNRINCDKVEHEERDNETETEYSENIYLS